MRAGERDRACARSTLSNMKALIPAPAAMVMATLAKRPSTTPVSRIEASNPEPPLSVAVQASVAKAAAAVA